MEADQRPWVSENPRDGFAIVTPLTFNKSGAEMRIAYKLRNTGKSPALHARFHGKIVSLPMKTNARIEIENSQDAFCGPIRNVKEEFGDSVIFPGDEWPGEEPLSASKDDISNAVRDKESGPMRHPGFVSLYAIICIDYRVVSKVEHFQTRYVFTLGTPMDSALTMIMADIKPEGIHPEVKMILFSQSAD